MDGRHSTLLCRSLRHHPVPSAACATLERVGGNPALLTRRPNVACTMEYAPVTVTAVGYWDGSAYRYRQTFANRCELFATTGSLFQF
ncbi:serine protease [Nonomuraea sp. NN258]|nr:serine protease [Nonomuraea antri]